MSESVVVVETQLSLFFVEIEIQSSARAAALVVPGASQQGRPELLLGGLAQPRAADLKATPQPAPFTGG